MENLNQAEAGILLWIQENLRTEWLDHIMPYVSKINDHGILAIIGVIVLLLWTRYRKVGITAFGSLAVEFTIVNLLIKPNVQRTRPFYVLEDLHLLGSLPTDFSFPSRPYGFSLCRGNRNANVYACKVWGDGNCGIGTDCVFQTI